MFPSITIFGKMITSYTILVLIAVFVVGIAIIKRGQKYKIDDNEMIVLLLIASIGIVVGGHLLFGLVNIKLIINVITKFYKITSFGMFIECVKEIFGGQVFYGGLLGGLAFGYLYLKKKHKDINLYSYIITPFIPLFHFFGRIGCFLSGCCYGIESKFGFTYTQALVPSANGVSRFPVQLLEAAFNLILFIVLLTLQKKQKLKNNTLPVYLISYAIGRFFIEFLRGDTYRGIWLGLSTSQIISILILLSTTIYLIFKNKPRVSKN